MRESLDSTTKGAAPTYLEIEERLGPVKTTVDVDKAVKKARDEG